MTGITGHLYIDLLFLQTCQTGYSYCSVCVYSAGGSRALAKDEGAESVPACRRRGGEPAGSERRRAGLPRELPGPQSPAGAAGRGRPGHRQPSAGGRLGLPVGGLDSSAAAGHVQRALLLLRRQPGRALQHGP